MTVALFNPEESKRLAEIKEVATKLGVKFVSPEDKQFCIDLAIRMKAPVPVGVKSRAAGEGYTVTGLQEK